MSVYAVFTYNITNPEAYQKYMPGSAPAIMGTIAKHGGQIIFATPEAKYLAGDAKHMSVCIKFPSEEAVHAWENDPEYAQAKEFRLAASTDYDVLIAPEFVMPQG